MMSTSVRLATCLMLCAVSSIAGTAPSSITLSTSPNPSYLGQSVTLTAVLEATGCGVFCSPTGNVNFYDRSTLLGTVSTFTAIPNPFTFVLVTSQLAPGAHSLTASYTGDGNIAASTSIAVVQTVTPQAAPTLTSTFQFTASGYIGTPATATTPFQGQTFTNAAITITAIGSIANVQTMPHAYCLPSDSATVSISGVGTFQFPASGIVNSIEVDPVKGVLGNSIVFYGSSSPCSTTGPVATTIQGSTAWNMLSSFGPFQANINLYSQGYLAVTNGGTLQFNNYGAAPSTFQATVTGTPPSPTLSRVGVLSHIAAGGTIGGWTTVITLVNNSASSLPVTVALHNEDGSSMTLPMTITQGGISQSETTSSVNATINPQATLQISMGNGIASTTVGWADVLSSRPLGGFAIFRQTPPTGSPSEGTVPLQTQFPTTLTLPYDDTAGFTMGVALANLATTAANIAVTIWDENGNQIGTQNIAIDGSGHTSFVLPTLIPATSGALGIVQFRSSGGLAGLGLRFSPFGTFTSLPTL